MKILIPEVKERMEKQQYRFAGSHSSVKICGWTKKDIKKEGHCYKGKFYGISSHECMQMTPNISCANRCVFCWRDMKTPMIKDEWKEEWMIEEPEFIYEKCVKNHRDLLIGLKGNPNIDKEKLERSMNPKHVALSLSGEPIMYPKINELVDLFHRNKITTFLVTNGQHPEAVKNLKEVTQLYISVDAPNKELLKEIDKPIFQDYWERLNKSLEYLSQKKSKKSVRLTLIKGMNDCDLEGYASLVKKGNPDFVEVKGYMFVGSSRQRLSIKNMPYHEEVKKFAEDLSAYLTDYKIVNEHEPSRVVLLAKSKDTKIDFDKFFEKIVNGKLN